MTSTHHHTKDWHEDTSFDPFLGSRLAIYSSTNPQKSAGRYGCKSSTKAFPFRREFTPASLQQPSRYYALRKTMVSIGISSQGPKKSRAEDRVERVAMGKEKGGGKSTDARSHVPAGNQKGSMDIFALGRHTASGSKRSTLRFRAPWPLRPAGRSRRGDRGCSRRIGPPTPAGFGSCGFGRA